MSPDSGVPDALIAEPGFSALVRDRPRRARAHAAVRHGRVAGRDGREHAPARDRPGRHRGDRAQPRPLGPRDRDGGPRPGARPHAPAGDDPPRVLGAAADPLPGARPGRAARDEPVGPGGAGVRDRGGAPAVVPARRRGADHRRGRPHDRRSRPASRATRPVRDGALGARPADPRRPGAGRPPRATAGSWSSAAAATPGSSTPSATPAASRARTPSPRSSAASTSAVRCSSRSSSPRSTRSPTSSPALLVPAHCTGWRAVHRLAARFPDAFVMSAVGTTITL